MSALPTTADLQALTRPELDEVFAALGQTVLVSRVQPGTGDPPPPEEIDEHGNVILPEPVTPPGTLPGAAYPAFVYQVPSEQRARYGSIGADVGVPLWEALIHHSAALDAPGFTLTVQGGEFIKPLPLTPIEDAEDIGTQGLCWRVTCRAQRAREG